MTPFLKWAGGKRWLVKQQPDIFPKECNRYIEPFLGSAACFFFLKPESAILSDANNRLVETYRAIRDTPEKVERLLAIHQRQHSNEYYYQVRAKQLQTPHTRAAQFIYLNRTCYNGLYRENKSGQFNVPIGTKNSVVLSTDNFSETSKLLGNTEIFHEDFESIIDLASRGDFIFADPPYTTAHNLNGFIKYNQKIFSWEDQIRLEAALTRASQRGAKILMTNAAHSSVKELYEHPWEVFELSRRSVISGLNKGRSNTTEFLISNFELPQVESVSMNMVWVLRGKNSPMSR